MAIEYEIIEEKRLVIAKGSGIVTGDDVMRHLEALAADERYVAPMKKLVDYSSIDAIMQSNEEIILIVRKKEALKQRFAGERCAFVTPNDLAFGIARVHEAYVNSTIMKAAVFRRLEEALAWLDVESNPNSE